MVRILFHVPGVMNKPTVLRVSGVRSLKMPATEAWTILLIYCVCYFSLHYILYFFAKELFNLYFRLPSYNHASKFWYIAYDF